MKTTQHKILNYIKINKEVSPNRLAKHFGLGNAMIHRHLKKLIQNGKISKKGTPPKVLYFYLHDKLESRIEESLNYVFENFLTKSNKKNEKFWRINDDENINFSFLLQKSAFFSSKIEGNSLDINSFMNKEALNKGKNKEILEIKDLIKGYEFAKTHAMDEKNVLNVHKIISKRLVAKNRQGVYRNEPVGVFSTKGLEYLAIEPNLIESEMSIFFASIQKLLDKKMIEREVYIISLWIHLQFVLIHPFSDGNGRMARLLQKWFLTQKLDKKYWRLETEEYYWNNLNEYYGSLKLGNNYWDVEYKYANKFFDK